MTVTTNGVDEVLNAGGINKFLLFPLLSGHLGCGHYAVFARQSRAYKGFLARIPPGFTSVRCIFQTRRGGGGVGQ